MKRKILCVILSLAAVLALMIPCASASDGEEMLLACAIEAAAQGESYTVMASVGSVLVNRLKSSSYPESLAAVIADAGIDISGVIPSSRAYRAALDALGGFDPTSGAMEYSKGRDENSPVLLSTDGWCFY